MSNLAEIIKITKEIGLEGDDLKSFVKEKAFLTDVPGKTKVTRYYIKQQSADKNLAIPRKWMVAIGCA